MRSTAAEVILSDDQRSDVAIGEEGLQTLFSGSQQAALWQDLQFAYYRLLVQLAAGESFLTALPKQRFHCHTQTTKQTELE